MTYKILKNKNKNLKKKRKQKMKNNKKIIKTKKFKTIII